MSALIGTYAKRFAAFVLALTIAGCGFSRVLADWKIDQLCKQDGGVKVFEKDVPPKEFLWPNGKINSSAIGRAKKGDTYFLVRSTRSIQTGEPSIGRDEVMLVRNRDEKVLGVGVMYVRPMDSLGPFSLFPISYMCPANGSDHPLLEAVFGVEAASF